MLAAQNKRRPPSEAVVGEWCRLEARAQAGEPADGEIDTPVDVTWTASFGRGKPASPWRHEALDDPVIRTRGGGGQRGLPFLGGDERSQRHALGVAAQHGLEHPVLGPVPRAIEPADLGGEARGRDEALDQRGLRAREPASAAKERPECGEAALGLGHHGARIVEPEDATLEERARGGKLVEVLRRVVSQHDVHGEAVGGDDPVFHGQGVRVHDLPFPAASARLTAEQIREPELLAVSGVAEDGETWAPPCASAVSTPGGREGTPEARPRPAIRVVPSRADLFRSPDLPLPGRLVAVVLERGQPAVSPLEDVEAPPEKRRAERAARIDVLGEGKVGKNQVRQGRVMSQKPVGEAPQQGIERDGGAREIGGERWSDGERDR